MKKLLASVLLALATCCALCACNTGENSETHETVYTYASAYARATDLGFTGTLDEFIELISGKDGKDGVDGKDGIDGVDGKDGLDGKDGKDGVDGVDGIDGTNGKNGKDGVDGKDGRGITSVTVNSDGELIISFTDGTSANLGKVFSCVHNYSDWEKTLAPTCTSVGYDTRVCTKCGDIDYKFYEKLGHDYANEVTVIGEHCTERGLKVLTCSRCGDTKSEVIEPVGHSLVYPALTCVYCGKHVNDINAEETFIFRLINNGTEYEVDRLRDFHTSGVVEIPSTYNGLPVTSLRHFINNNNITGIIIPETINKIGHFPFMDCDSLETITVKEGNPVYHSSNNCLIETATKTLIAGGGKAVIPDDGSVTTIANRAFYHINSLTKIAIPEGVTEISANAFYFCSNLTEVTLPNSVTYIGSYAFYLCKNLEKINIPNGITEIKTNTFSRCEKLTEIVIPNGVTSIGEDAFSSTGLTEINIPNSVISIGETAFPRTINNISVADGNPVYHSNGNCLIETATKTLILGCRNSVIPDDGSVTSIGSYSFAYIESLVIPDGIVYIADNAFYGCRGLTSIVIPDSVKTIGKYAFSYCYDLESVTIGTGVEFIDQRAFGYSTSLKSAIFKDHASWTRTNRLNTDREIFDYDTLSDPLNAALLLKQTCDNEQDLHNLDYVWTKSTKEQDLNSDWLYRLINDGTEYEVIGPKNRGISGVAEIPSTYNGLPVTSIERFKGCYNLTGIIIPETITKIGDFPFLGCYNLETITVKNGNPVYHSSNNCLIETAAKKLIAGCNTSVIPSDGSVTSIGDKAFSKFNFTQITIPDEIVSIDRYAFLLCTNLESVTIGSGVEFIDTDPFRGCTNLNSVIFKDNDGWTRTDRLGNEQTITAEILSDPSAATELLKDITNAQYVWTKNTEN